MKKLYTIILTIGVLLFIQSLGAQTWEKTKRLTWSVLDSDFPKLATDSSNNIHLVWHDTTVGTNVLYKTSSDGGISWSKTRRLTWTYNNWYPVIAVDTNDNIHLLWFAQVKGGVWYKRSTDGGVTWAGVKRLSWSTPPIYPQGIAVALDSSDNIHVVFSDPPGGEIYYKRSTDGGLSWTKTKRLTWNSASSYFTSIATDSNDNIHIVWREGFQVYYKKSTNGGDSWSAAKTIFGTSGAQSDPPDIAIDSNNHIHVVTAGSQSLYYKKSTDEGITWDGAKKLSTVGQRPAIAVDSNNHIHVAMCAW